LGIALVVAFGVLFLRAGGWGEQLGFGETWRIGLGILFCLMAASICFTVAIGPRTSDKQRFDVLRPSTAPAEYAELGLGPLSADVDPRELYIDVVKRTVSNIIYEDAPLGFYDNQKTPQLARHFSLKRRVLGEDMPSAAHTMIGIQRLNNLQFCVEDVLRNNVPGDLVEAGVLRGGATIFMRAILKAHGVTDRRVFVCDTFVPPEPLRPHWIMQTASRVVRLMDLIPGKAWQKRLVMLAQRRMPDSKKMFPSTEDPSDELVQLVMWYIRNPSTLSFQRGTGLDDVKSHFARYGLLDDQVLFLKGFFSNTLPTAPVERAAVIRLDGDLYESTMDVLNSLYDKLSPGGYCIVDDYNSFDDCSRAVDVYRAEHNITDELRPIDNLSVYWQKSS
jgi:hypothetical protein